MNTPNLRSLSDDELLRRLSDILASSRRVESVLVAHLAEVDARRLYLREALPSMHRYCTDVLHLSDSEAYFRITAARASRRFPVLLTMLEDGRLHLSGIEVLAPHMTPANCQALLSRSIHKSKNELKEIIAELAPKPDVLPRVRKLPERRNVSRAKTEPRQPTADTPPLGSRSMPSERAGPELQDDREHVEPLSPARYKVQFTASAELRDKLEKLKRLTPGNDLAAAVESAVTEKLDRLEAQRYGKVKHPRKSVEQTDTSPGARNIPAPVRRLVWKRDGGQCTFVSHGGRRCPERHRLEFHHDDPYGRGGDRTPANIRLLCKQHNLYRAELDYGQEAMNAFRRGVERVREPGPSFGTDAASATAASALGFDTFRATLA